MSSVVQSLASQDNSAPPTLPPLPEGGGIGISDAPSQSVQSTGEVLRLEFGKFCFLDHLDMVVTSTGVVCVEVNRP